MNKDQAFDKVLRLKKFRTLCERALNMERGLRQNNKLNDFIR